MQDVVNIWGFRRAVYASIAGRSYAAVFDEWDNCLGGSCDTIQQLLGRLQECRAIARREVSAVASTYAFERRYELIYACSPEVLKRLGIALEPKESPTEPNSMESVNSRA
jgi:hypothetical protein